MSTAKSLLKNATDAYNSCPNLKRFKNVLECFELHSVNTEDPPSLTHLRLIKLNGQPKILRTR